MGEKGVHDDIVPAPALTVRQAAGRVFAEQVRELMRHHKAARKGDDPEAVHQMRVSTRRLRAALRIFRGYLAPRKRIAEDLRWLARRLGAVRDHDVILALLEERHLSVLAGIERARLENLVAGLKERRFAAQEKLERALARKRHARLARSLKTFAARPRFTGDEDAMAARTLGDGIAAWGATIAEEPGMTHPAPTAVELHALRIDIKRLRYVLDFHAATCGMAFEVERRLTRDMQDCLGELHDHDLLLGWLEQGQDFFAGPWPVLYDRLASDRASLLRRFLRLRKRWKERTGSEPTVAPLEEPRFVNLEPAPVTLKLVVPTRKDVASGMIA
jgi:CHAD domain-containing protein